MRRIIFTIIALVLTAGFVTPASAFVFGFQADQNGNFAFAISVPDNQENQYYEPQPQHQWPRNRQHHRPEYNIPPAPPPGWVFKNDYEQQGGHCGRIAYDQGEWFCRPE